MKFYSATKNSVSKSLVLFFFFQLLLINGLLAQADKKAVSNSTRQISSGKTWAVIVGISKYKNIPGLLYADKDAQAFYNYLVNMDGGPRLDGSKVKLLLNEDALSTEIYGALDWLRESVKENDRVIFYFSG